MSGVLAALAFLPITYWLMHGVHLIGRPLSTPQLVASSTSAR